MLPFFSRARSHSSLVLLFPRSHRITVPLPLPEILPLERDAQAASCDDPAGTSPLAVPSRKRRTKIEQGVPWRQWRVTLGKPALPDADDAKAEDCVVPTPMPVSATLPLQDTMRTSSGCLQCAAVPMTQISPPSPAISNAVDDVFVLYAHGKPHLLHEMLRLAEDLETRLYVLMRTTAEMDELKRCAGTDSGETHCTDRSDVQCASSDSLAKDDATLSGIVLQDSLDVLAANPVMDAVAASIREKAAKAATAAAVLVCGGGSGAKLLPAHLPHLHQLVLLLRFAARAHPIMGCSVHSPAAASYSDEGSDCESEEELDPTMRRLSGDSDPHSFSSDSSPIYAAVEL